MRFCIIFYSSFLLTGNPPSEKYLVLFLYCLFIYAFVYFFIYPDGEVILKIYIFLITASLLVNTLLVCACTQLSLFTSTTDSNGKSEQQSAALAFICIKLVVVQIHLI